jgi:hypothetical protein
MPRSENGNRPLDQGRGATCQADPARPATETAGDNAGPAIETAEEIADFARWFGPSVFPADQAELRCEAWTTRAPQWVLDRLDGLDPQRRVASITELHDITG